MAGVRSAPCKPRRSLAAPFAFDQRFYCCAVMRKGIACNRPENSIAGPHPFFAARIFERKLDRKMLVHPRPRIFYGIFAFARRKTTNVIPILAASNWLAFGGHNARNQIIHE